MTASPTARTMWSLFEPVHVLTYFSPEAQRENDALGLRGFWMGYFATRSAPLGKVAPRVVEAAFYGFQRWRVERALPDAWTFCSPQDALRARLAGAAHSLESILGPVADQGDSLSRMVELAEIAAAAADVGGRPLAAANQALDRPTGPYERLWQACTTLREHRGDGHLSALVSSGVSGIQSHFLKVAAGQTDTTYLQRARDITDQDWAAARIGLQERGWAGPGESESLTREGERARIEIEAMTDAAASSPWDLLGPAATAELADLLRPVAVAVHRSGVLPMPNPIGMPPPDR